MYNFNITFGQRWRKHFVLVCVWWGLTSGHSSSASNFYLGLFWLIVSAIGCAYAQFIFQRNIKRYQELRRRAARGEFQGTGNWY